MLTVNDDKSTKLAALNAGADDYVLKRFDTEELEARLRAVLRRSAHEQSNSASGVIHVHNLVSDLVKRRVMFKGDEIHLTPTEYKLLVALASHPGKVLTLNTLILEIQGLPKVRNLNTISECISIPFAKSCKMISYIRRSFSTSIRTGSRLSFYRFVAGE
jgi:two-component system KDP operon response regulator KdpE